MKNNNKQMTFEQLSEIYDMSISEINNTINIAYNKMVTALVKKQVDIWDAVVGLKEYFGISEKEAVEKLNIENRKLLMRSASNKR